MKYHFTLVSLLVIAAQAGCSGGEESPDPGTGGSNSAAGQPGGVAGAAAGTGGTSSNTGGSSAAGTSGSVGGGASAGASTGGASTGGQAGSSTGGSAGTGTSGGSSAGGGGGGAGGASGGSTSGGAGGAGGGAMDGASLYMSKCAACHGQQGVGGPLGPELQHPVRDYSSWVVRHGRASTTFPAPMVAVPASELSDASLEKIWDYLDQPPQPTSGQALYGDYCANCHGADGKGGPTMRSIVNELGELKTRVRQGAHPGEFDQRREYMPAFAATRITDAELDAIYKYVDSL